MINNVLTVQFFSWSDELSICLLFIQNHYFWWPQFVFLTAHNLRRSKWTKGCIFSKALFHQDALLSALHCPLTSVNPWCWVLFEFFVWFLADIKQPVLRCWMPGLINNKTCFQNYCCRDVFAVQWRYQNVEIARLAQSR